MDRGQKQAFIDELAGKLAEAQCVYVTDFTGLDVERITRLRSKLRGSGVDYVVVKNTLARRAIAGTSTASVESLLEGPTAFAVSRVDAVAAAKALMDFAKDGDLPRIKGGVVAGRIMSLDEIGRLAALPGRDVLLGQLVGSLRSPIQGCVLVLAGVVAKLVRTVDALRSRKAEQGDAAPAAEASRGGATPAPVEASEAIRQTPPPAGGTPAAGGEGAGATGEAQASGGSDEAGGKGQPDEPA